MQAREDMGGIQERFQALIMQERSIFVILKATSTDRQTRRLHIFKTFCIYLASDNTLIILVHSDQMTSEARTHK